MTAVDTDYELDGLDLEDEEDETAELSEELLDDDIIELSETDANFVAQLVDRIWQFITVFTGIEMFPYQEEFGKRIIESIVLADGDTVTGEFSRQSGKTETLSNVISGLMVILPILAKMYPRWLKKFERGFWVGCFAPIESQVETLFGRIVDRLTCEHALEILEDPEIGDMPKSGGARFLRLKKSGSFVRMQTANPRAKIESKSYHFMVLDEAQGIDEYVIGKSIEPMGAFYKASMVMIGTPDVVKGAFYKTIQFNRRTESKRGTKKNHYRFDWKYCARYNPNYKASVKKQALRLGEDSDEFRLNYRLEWLLERGMFITEERMDSLGDTGMQLVHSWWKTPVLAGIDCARKMDSTVVTVVWVDWDHPDADGLYDHRILDWLELHGENWEEQYFQIVDFLARYNCMAVGIDAQGMGDVVADRLARLLPSRTQVVPIDSTRPEQSKRWKHLQQLIQKGMVSWPAHPKAKRTKIWKRFRQQMVDLEKKYEQSYLLAEAPDEAEAHDDFPDSLALACILTKEFVVEESEMASNPMLERNRH